MKPALIFDLDGTLFDSRESILESIRHALSKIGRREQVDEIKAVRQDLFTTLRETAAKYGTRFSDEERFRFIRAYRAHQKDTVRSTIKVFDGVREGLSELREFFALGVATTKTSDQAIHILQEFELDSFFDHVQGTDKGLKYKPAPDILWRVAEKLSVPSDRSVYIGDSPHDLVAARSAGMAAVGAAYGYSELHELTAHEPDAVIHRFREVLDLPHYLTAGQMRLYSQ